MWFFVIRWVIDILLLCLFVYTFTHSLISSSTALSLNEVQIVSQFDDFRSLSLSDKKKGTKSANFTLTEFSSLKFTIDFGIFPLDEPVHLHESQVESTSSVVSVPWWWRTGKEAKLRKNEKKRKINDGTKERKTRTFISHQCQERVRVAKFYEFEVLWVGEKKGVSTILFGSWQKKVWTTKQNSLSYSDFVF